MLQKKHQDPRHLRSGGLQRSITPHFFEDDGQTDRDRLWLRERFLGKTSTTSSSGGRSKGLYIGSKPKSTSSSLPKAVGPASKALVISSGTAAGVSVDVGGTASSLAARHGNPSTSDAGSRPVATVPPSVSLTLRHNSFNDDTAQSRHHKVSVESAWKGRNMATSGAAVTPAEPKLQLCTGPSCKQASTVDKRDGWQAGDLGTWCRNKNKHKKTAPALLLNPPPFFSSEERRSVLHYSGDCPDSEKTSPAVTALCPEGHSDTVPVDPPSLRVEAVDSMGVIAFIDSKEVTTISCHRHIMQRTSIEVAKTETSLLAGDE